MSIENLPEKNYDKENQLLDQIKEKLLEQEKVWNRMKEITERLVDISTNIGKENARVMIDIKYRDEYETLFAKDKELNKEIKELEEERKKLRTGK